MGIKRIVDVDFWNDDKVLEMFSPEDKLFMLYLLTNPHTTQLGIYAINVKHFAFELGYSTDTIKVLLDRFENKYKIIKYDHKTKEVAIRNFLVFSIVKGGKPVFDCLTRELKAVKSADLIAYVYENLSNKSELNKTVVDFLDILKEKSNKKENNENDNDNENENDVSYHDSYHDSSNESSVSEPIINKPKKNKKTKHKYGTYKHVLLTDEEYKKLLDKYGEFNLNKVIDFFDRKIELKGYKYKSHYLAILDWAGEAALKENSKETRSFFQVFLES